MCAQLNITMPVISSITKLFLILVLSTAKISFAAEINIPADYKTIQEGIDNSSASDVIIIAPGTYEESITLESNITLRGKETARTIIESPSSSPAIAINNNTNVTIKNLTITGPTIGIEVTNSTSNIIITNNVFALGTKATPSGTAIEVTDDTSAVSILFNTFYANKIAIDRQSDLRIENNIFSDNTTDINTGAENKIDYNCFKSTSGTGTNATASAAISFVDVALLDFHLQAETGTSCIDTDNGATGDLDVIDDSIVDSGAYGGPDADKRPFPPQNVLLSPVSNVTAPQINITWRDNLSYLVTGVGTPKGNYKVYYDTDKSGEPYTGEGNDPNVDKSPINVLQADTIVLSDLKIPTSTIAPPVVSISPSFQTLDVSWTADSKVTSYTLNYGISSVTENTETTSDTSFTISGLTNNEIYQVMVTAHFQPKYYIAVTSYDKTSDANESDFSLEKTIDVGPSTDEPSTIVTSIPELVVLFPELSGEGCFIATAAFGYYSAAEVQVLRNFRDQFLLSSQAGRNFVNWYYTYGPNAAQYLHTYPALKPMVRVLLLPLVYYAKFLLNTSVMTQMLVSLLLAMSLILFISSRINHKNATYNI